MLSKFIGKRKTPSTTDLRIVEKQRSDERRRKQEHNEKLREDYERKKKVLKSTARRAGVLGKYMAKDVGHAAKVAWHGLGQVADNLEKVDRREAAAHRRVKHRKQAHKAGAKKPVQHRDREGAQKVVYIEGRKYVLQEPGVKRVRVKRVLHS